MASPIHLPPSRLRWLYVDLNSYFASVEQQLHPELRGRPVIVVPVMSDSTCAIAASYEAKALGIKTGTPVHEAKRRCRDLALVMARHGHYTDYHHRIIDEIDRHIPVSQVCSIDEMACELLDNEHDPAFVTDLAMRIKQGIRQNVGEALGCSIGVAPNRYLAKVAADMQKPDGLTLLLPDDIPERLLPLRLQDFPGIGPNMARRLYAAGVFSTERLLSLNAAQMRRIWHSLWGERMWYYLRGYQLDDPATEKRTVGHSHVLAPEYRVPGQARHIARRLTSKAASRLRRFEYDCTALTLSVRLEEGGRYVTERRFPRVQDTPALLAVLTEAWDALMQQVAKRRLKKVSITLHGLIARADRQLNLLDTLDLPDRVNRQRAEKLSHAMDILNRKYGKDTILMGLTPEQGEAFSGTKIAFTRIPDVEEFHE